MNVSHFSTDEDARQAMLSDGGKIKQVKIKLLLSSRAEMQKVIEHARQQSMTLQNFMQIPTPPLSHALTSLMNSLPSNLVATSTPPLLPQQTTDAQVPPIGPLIEKKDSDTVSNSSKDRRKERSRSRENDRRDRKDRDRERDRHRGSDRRRRDRSRSRDRRRRRDRTRSRDRSRSRENKHNTRADSSKKEVVSEDDKDQNGDVVVVAQYQLNKDKTPAPSKQRFIEQPEVQQKNVVPTSPAKPVAPPNTRWDGSGVMGGPNNNMMANYQQVAPGQLPGRPGPLAMPDGNLDMRRGVPNTNYPGNPMPGNMNMPGEGMPNVFMRNENFGMPHENSPAHGWQMGRQPAEQNRFQRNERPVLFPNKPERQQTFGNKPEPGRGPPFPNEMEDYEREYDTPSMGRGFRGGYRGNSDYRRMPYMGREGRGGPVMMGTGLLDRMGPGSMPGDVNDRRNMNSFQPGERRGGYRMGMDRGENFRMGADRGEMDHRPGERFDNFDRVYAERPFISRPGTFAGERFPRERFPGAGEQPYDPRVKVTGLCVEIRHMPPEAGYSDVKNFFQGLTIVNNGIKIINDNHGNRVGMAYVRFFKQEDKEYALAFNCKPLRGSLVEILHLEENIFEKAIDSYKPARENALGSDSHEASDNKGESLGQYVCLLVSDLPAYVKEEDIFKMFQDFTVVEVVLSINTKTLISEYKAYVKFSKHDGAKKALHATSKHIIGQKKVCVKPCSVDELVEARKLQNGFEDDKTDMEVDMDIVEPDESEKDKLESIEIIVPNTEAVVGRDTGPNLASVSSDCILLKGLPLQVTDRDILDFFSDVGLVPLRIHVILDKSGKPNGEAFCEFNSIEESIRSLSKDNSHMGKQEISVKSIPRIEMQNTLGINVHQTDHNSNPPLRQNMSGRMHHGPGGPPRMYSGGRGGLLGTSPASGPMGGPGRVMPLLGRHMPYEHHHSPVESFGQPGCVLALENIPFRSDVNEILHFFGDFDLSQENVIRRFTENGMTTGDARVAFKSPSEAQRALRELRHGKMRGRPIYMRLLV